MTTHPRVRPVPGAPRERAAPADVLPRVRLVPVLTAMAIAAFLLAILWVGVREGIGPATLDPVVLGRIVSARSATVVTLARLVTDAGSPVVSSAVLVVVAVAVSWRRGHLAPAAVMGAGLVAAAGVELAVKALVARPRPPVAWHAVAEHGWSFPSGHATLSAAVALLVLWVWRPASGSRVVAGGLAAAAVLLVGLSRVVLGVHYPSDVLAGWCVAVLAVGVVLLGATAVTRRARVGDRDGTR